MEYLRLHQVGSGAETNPRAGPGYIESLGTLDLHTKRNLHTQEKPSSSDPWKRPGIEASLTYVTLNSQYNPAYSYILDPGYSGSLQG